jgi:4-hydroxythreonine-4-phosphate dehydrogenase
MGSPERRLRIALTLGDPGGIGPEIISKALSKSDVLELGEFVVFGQRELIEADVEVSDAGHPVPPEAADTHGPTPEGGRASVAWILAAIEAAQSGDVDAVVTAPISKEAMKLGGHSWPGHTEILKEKTGSERAVMTMVGGGLRVALVTTHMAVADVPAALTRQDIHDTTAITDDALRRYFACRAPRIAVCALNPHAGESGMFGAEDEAVIAPAIEAARAQGIDCTGPVPADVVFHQAFKGAYDAVVAMYHDQGTIPVKLLAFETGVNVTLGLPIIRTSPDHGTAYDIAGQGTADPGSMVEAIRLAASMAARKRAPD